MKRTLPLICGLLGAVLALFVTTFGGSTANAKAGSGSLSSSTSTHFDADHSEPRRPLVVLRGLGTVAAQDLRAACTSLLEAFPVRCEVRTQRDLDAVASAWDSERDQLEARAALDLMFQDRMGDALVEINLTELDIYEPRKPYVFGLASLTDRVTLISMARISTADAAGQRNRLDRLHKLVLHEAGHALGLHHHEHEGCVMRQDPTVASLDTAPDHLCAACHRVLAKAAQQLARPGQLQLDRARGYLVRGAPEAARKQLLAMSSEAPFNSDLYNAFGLAFFEARRFDDAIDTFRIVTQLAPSFAEAHVNLGLAYQMRSTTGDRQRAIAQFRRALELRPQWDLVAAHLDGLQSDSASAQGPSIR